MLKLQLELGCSQTGRPQECRKREHPDSSSNISLSLSLSLSLFFFTRLFFLTQSRGVLGVKGRHGEKEKRDMKVDLVSLHLEMRCAILDPSVEDFGREVVITASSFLSLSLSLSLFLSLSLRKSH